MLGAVTVGPTIYPAVAKEDTHVVGARGEGSVNFIGSREAVGDRGSVPGPSIPLRPGHGLRTNGL